MSARKRQFLRYARLKNGHLQKQTPIIYAFTFPKAFGIELEFFLSANSFSCKQ